MCITRIVVIAALSASIAPVCGCAEGQVSELPLTPSMAYEDPKRVADAKFTHKFEKDLCEYAWLKAQLKDSPNAHTKFMVCLKDAMLKFWDELQFPGRDILQLEYAKRIAVGERLDKKRITGAEADVLISEAHSEALAALRQLELNEALIDTAFIQASAARSVAQSAREQAAAANRQADAAEQQADAVSRKLQEPRKPITCTGWANTVTCR